MTLLPMKTPKRFAHKLASLQNRAWLPPAILLLALSSMFIFGYDQRGYFYRGGTHARNSAKALAIAGNLSLDHHFLMFEGQTLDPDGKTVYKPYNRFPIGGFALIRLAIAPFGDDLSAKIYAARMLMLALFVAAAGLAYLSISRIASSRWIALTSALLAFSSAYCLYYSDKIHNEVIIDLFAVMLAFHGMVVFEQERRFRQLMLKAGAALFLGWHVYALLLPFIAFGLMRELIKTYSGGSASPYTVRRLKPAALSLMRSRYLTLGVAAILFGVSILAFNFTNEYFALDRETPLAETPSFISVMNRTGIDLIAKYDDWTSWPVFPERQLYRIGVMSLPYAFSSSYALEHRALYNPTDEMPRLLVMLGIAASGASLIGLLFFRRHKILLASLALSGFCWALPLRHNTALAWHDYESVFYIGVPLTLFSLALLWLRRLSGDRVVVGLSVAALLIFVFSALRMAQLNNVDNQTGELHKATIADFEVIRKIADKGEAIQTNVLPKFHIKMRHLTPYYLAGRAIMYGNETVTDTRQPDFAVTGVRLDGIASLTPQNRMVFLYEWDAYHHHIDEMIAQAGEPLIGSDFDVYLTDNTLMYIKDACRLDDTKALFFLALYPVHEIDLPQERRQHGFDNLDFLFEDQVIRRGERCIAIAPLPEYDIARIQTGQFIQQADGSYEHLWEGDVRLTEAAH